MFKIKPIKTSISDLHPVLAFDNGKVYFKDSSVAINFKFDGPEDSLWSEASYENAYNVLDGILNNLPLNCTLQKTDIYYEDSFKDNGLQKPYFEQARVNYLLGRPILRHKGYLSVIFSPEGEKRKSVTNNSSLNERHYEKQGGVLEYFKFHNKLDEIIKSGERIEELMSNIKLQLNGIPDVKITQLSDEENQDLYKQFFNLEFEHTPDSYSRAIKVDNSGNIGLGEKYVNMVTMTSQSEEVYPVTWNRVGNGKELRGIINPLTHYMGVPHILTQTFYRFDIDKQVQKLESEARKTKLFGSKKEAEFLQNDIKELINEIKEEQKQLVNTSISVALFTSDKTKIESNVSRSLVAFNKMYSAAGFVESFDTLGLFMSMVPGNGHNNFRGVCMPVDVASTYLNWNTSIKSDGEGEMFIARGGQPIYVDLFSKRVNNKNMLVIAPSGGGKSYVVAEIIEQRFEQDDIQVIIDNGGTYKNLMDSLNGVYFEYDPQNPLSFNPFLIERKNTKEPLDLHKKEFLTSLIFLIWKQGKSTITPGEKAVMHKWLSKYYAQISAHQTPSLIDFVNWLDAYNEMWVTKKVDPALNDTDRRKQERDIETHITESTSTLDIKDFFTVIERFTTGDLSFLFNGTKDLDLTNKNLICFDMKSIKTHEILYPVVTTIVIELVTDLVRTHKEKRKHLYLEEAWSVLAKGSDDMGEFFDSASRTIRKENGSLTIITQEVTELMNDFGSGIKSNSDTYLLPLNQDLELRGKISDFLGLTETEQELYNSLRVTEGGREIFLKQNERSIVLEIDVPDEVHYVISSNPIEREKFNKYKDRYAESGIPSIDVTKGATNQMIEDKRLNS